MVIRGARRGARPEEQRAERRRPRRKKNRYSVVDGRDVARSSGSPDPSPFFFFALFLRRDWQHMGSDWTKSVRKRGGARRGGESEEHESHQFSSAFFPLRVDVVE
jgi:hypothetical protein